MRDAVADYGINEYTPITHHCDCCGCELNDEEEVFEIYDGEWICADCFLAVCKENIDINHMAKYWGLRIRKAYET